VRPGANAARGNRVYPPGAGPHQALHTPRHLTAVSRRGETCPEAGSKRVIYSDKAGALPLATGFPLETVQVRGQTDPYTQRKCDGAPRRRVVKGWSWELGHTRPTGCRGQARAGPRARWHTTTWTPTALAHDDTLLRGAGAPRGPFGARLTNHDTLLRGAGAPRGPSSAQLTNHDTLLRGAGALRGPYSARSTYYDLSPSTAGPERAPSTRHRHT